MRRAGFLFTLKGRVSRRAYLGVGLGLMALKYGVEIAVIRRVTGAYWTPFDYFSPVYSVRADKLASTPDWFLLALGLWTLPFVWIGAAMTLRRARAAGLGGWAVVPFFAPLFNYLWMLFLAALPARELPEPEREAIEEDHVRFTAALPAVAVAALFGLGSAAFCIYVARAYGVTLFVGVPFLMGFTSAWLFNRHGDAGLGRTVGVATLALTLTGLLLLLFALEGLVCIAMVAGLALPLVCLGAVFGRVAVMARAPRSLGMAPAFLLLPSAWLEGRLIQPARIEVVTTIEIDAPPERVWPNVIGFAELPPPEHWLFATGIAYPLRAEIDGDGVGAVRRCEFSTGAFVEPITRWEPPARLSFDVAEAPLPMEEWSFYARVRPPHLEQSFRAVRGEFRLVELGGERTRLEGSTWYRLELFPLGYWRFVADEIVHRIHLRVLEHVARLSEDSVSGPRR